MKKWQDNIVFYQIYMPSFGEFKKITLKLNYLKELGVGCIWLTPFYPSPKIDNGYDISDYYNIDKDYGTMADFDDFLKKAHENNIRVIVDVVVNHTSNEHPWFIESKQSKESDKRDWYIWKDKKEEGLPNNWESFFGGNAWEWDEGSEEYYYHSFAKEQVDLNWGNEKVKKAVFEVLDFWIDKGIDGFRLDVINNLTIGKEFTDNPFDEKGKQIHRYDVNQIGIHEILKELREHVSARKEDIFLVGEISSDDLLQIHSYANENELNTTFNFNLGSKEEFDIEDFYKEIKAMTELYKEEKPTLFFGSHDMGRFKSRFKFDDKKVMVLITFLMTFRGIPFLYFGDEIGMENKILNNIEDARDIQGILAYERALKEGKTKEEAITILNNESRDKSRNTMQWNEVLEQEQDENSILEYTKRIIELRKNMEELRDGDCTLLSLKNDVICYNRKIKEREIMIILNFSNQEVTLESLDVYNYELLLTTNNIKDKIVIMPSSAMIFKMEEKI